MKFILTAQGLAEQSVAMAPILSGAGEKLGAGIIELIRPLGEAIITQLPGAFTFLAMALILIGMILADGKWFGYGFGSFIAGAISLTVQ